MGARGPLPGAGRAAARSIPAGGEPVPPPPDYLAAPARAEYLRIAGLAGDALTAADSTLLATYAQAVHEHAEISRKLTPENMTCKSATGGEYLNPLFNARSTVQKTIERCAAALGLSPAARARAGAPAGKTENDPEGPAAFGDEHGTDPA
jgi:P27 family predicted phage terminase small subunit